MKRVKPPFTPGLEAELMGRGRGLKQIRNFAERSTRLPVAVFGPEGCGKTSRLRRGFNAHIDLYWSINSHRRNSNPRLSSCNSEAGLHGERPWKAR
jgi:hypothetical protein